ncbi:gliding motility protein GldN [Mucilaginibacter sp. FT3.2]|uniref:type IX secretion system ring protein PorN/GldN n=1 Tax=Mucilaginibacter sp. FT3.2 TaxID=2723090 RepID=UPI0016210FCE|nr:gliding motility protein GldN [Mucilaginibacter sp. FT3.2]MBB6232839.1 gliding motility associated protein GldN [Mucilaginibacter sp. FT3.2]
MKKRILVVVLCLACITSYGQTKKKKRPAKKAAATTNRQVKPQANSVVSNPGPSVDTSKRVPMKPFERPLDGYFKKNNILNARVTPYPNLRESDVAFAKRVWREIDVRDKMNTYLASPKRRLIDVLLDAITAGELTAYDATQGKKDDINGDGFSTPLAAGAARARLAGGDSSVVSVPDKDGNIVSSKMVANEFNPDSVIKFRIKEDWVFDKQRSVFEPRIIGIAPLFKPKAAPGVDVGYQPAFWVYFPEARPILATKEVVSRASDGTGLSFDDVFMKRIFNSYIVKESNDKDESVKDYAQGIDKLYEAERIKKTLMDWELNLWQY